MKACNVLYQLHLCILGVIIPDCQLPKFTENTHKLHKIAYTIYNVQKLFAGGGRNGLMEFAGVDKAARSKIDRKSVV